FSTPKHLFPKAEQHTPNTLKTSTAWSATELQKEADKIAFARYVPAGFLINEDMEILQFRGDTSPYLMPVPGKASLNLLKLSPEGLLVELHSLLKTAKKTGKPVRKEGIRIRRMGRTQLVHCDILPIIAPTRERYFLVQLENAAEVK